MTDFNDMLPSQAAFYRARGQREAAEGIQWADYFTNRALGLLYEAYANSYPIGHSRASDIVETEVNNLIAANSRVADSRPWRPTIHDVFIGDVNNNGTDTVVDYVAAIAIVLERFADRNDGAISDDSEYAFTYSLDRNAFPTRANEIFLEERIAYVFVNNRLKPRGDEPLFLDVVLPVEAALTSNPKFAGAEQAYLQAQAGIAGGHYGAAIVSMGSALEETLKAMGATGANLGATFANARSRGFLLGHDERLLDAYKRIVDWTTANRSERGNGHGAATGERDDATMAVHIIAALIIRLIKFDDEQEAEAEQEQPEAPDEFVGF